MLVPMSKDDLGVIHNYLLDVASENGVAIPSTNILNNLKSIIEDDNAFICEIDNMVVGAIVWEDLKPIPYLTLFYILPKYRKNKKIITTMYKKVVDKFDGKHLKYTPLYKEIQNNKLLKNGFVDIQKAKDILSRIS